MSLKEIAEDAIPGVAPAKMIVRAVLGLIVVIALGWVCWKLFFAERAAQAKHDKVQAEAQGRVGQAEGSAGANAANVVAGRATKETIIRETTRENTREIYRQPGAGDPVTDAVDGAGRRAVCLRASAAGLPDCQRLQEADSR